MHMQNPTSTITLAEHKGLTNPSHARPAAELETKYLWHIAQHGFGANFYQVVSASPITEHEARKAALAHAESGFAADIVILKRQGAEPAAIAVAVKQTNELGREDDSEQAFDGGDR